MKYIYSVLRLRSSIIIRSAQVARVFAPFATKRKLIYDVRTSLLLFVQKNSNEVHFHRRAMRNKKIRTVFVLLVYFFSLMTSDGSTSQLWVTVFGHVTPADVCSVDEFLMFEECRPMWECPAKYGAVRTDTDDVSLVGTDLHSGDCSTVTDTDVGHHSLVVQPHLQNNVTPVKRTSYTLACRRHQHLGATLINGVNET